MNQPARSLLITGVSGLLGGEIARQATASGRFDVLWGAWFSQEGAGQLPGTKPIRLDITDPAAVLALAREARPDLIIHAAYSKDGPATWPVTAEGSRHVAQAAAVSGARLVHISSDVIFDGEHAPYAEESPAAPLHEYGRAKLAAEQAVRELTPAAALVRTSLIGRLEPLDKGSAWIVDSLRQGRPITLFTDELRSPIWVQDLAAAVLELAESDFAGPLHIAGPQALSRYAIGTRLARHFGLDPAGITAGVSRDSGLLRPRDLRLDTTLARRLLKTRLRSYDEGLAELEPLHGT